MPNNAELIMLWGIPASGKSTLAESYKQKGSLVYASDIIRKELYGDENIQGDANKVFNILHQRVVAALKDGQSVVYDATNLKAKNRRAFLNDTKNIDYHKKCIMVLTPYTTCLQNNASRERQVPVEVMERMYTNVNIPSFTEGWDEITPYYMEKTAYNTDNIIFNKSIFSPEPLISMKQDNPHHQHTIGRHCIDTYSEVLKMKNHRYNPSKNLLWAALQHDIGKGFTKVFADAKGNPTPEAHYYRHENVGAYISLIVNRRVKDIDPLTVALLIQCHMMPFQRDWEMVHPENKYLNQEQVKELRILHEADILAH